jgi:hypothetical protein
MQEPALARAPRHFVRVKGEPYIDKVVQSYSLLLYILAIYWLYMIWQTAGILYDGGTVQVFNDEDINSLNLSPHYKLKYVSV